MAYFLRSKDEDPTEVLEPIGQTRASEEPRRERLLLVFIQQGDLLGKVCWIPFLSSLSVPRFCPETSLTWAPSLLVYPP